MTELEFDKLAAAGYSRIPVLAEARADLYTPLAGLRHRSLAAEGVQFHPEAPLTGHGHRMLQNFVEGRIS